MRAFDICSLLLKPHAPRPSQYQCITQGLRLPPQIETPTPQSY